MYFFNFRENIINITNVIKLRICGIAVSSHSGARGSPKMDFMHISGQKEAIWNTLFSIFERWRGPQTSRAPGKLPLPLSGSITISITVLRSLCSCNHAIRLTQAFVSYDRFWRSPILAKWRNE